MRTWRGWIYCIRDPFTLGTPSAIAYCLAKCHTQQERGQNRSSSSFSATYLLYFTGNEFSLFKKRILSLVAHYRECNAIRSWLTRFDSNIFSGTKQVAALFGFGGNSVDSVEFVHIFPLKSAGIRRLAYLAPTFPQRELHGLAVDAADDAVARKIYFSESS